MTNTPSVPVVTPYLTDDPCPRTEVVVTPGADNVWLTVYRYSSAGRTILRGGNHVIVSGPLLINDYEVPLGEPVTYSAKGYNGVDVPGSESAASAPVTLNPPEGCPWIQDPSRPETARRVQVGTWTEQSYGRDSAILWPITGRRAVALVGPRRDSTSEIVLLTQTDTQAADLRSIFESTILLIRFDSSWSPSKGGYFHAGDVHEARRSLSDRTDQRRAWSTELTPVGQTASQLTSTFHTWAEVLKLYPKWSGVIAAKAKWIDLIRNPAPGA